MSAFGQHDFIHATDASERRNSVPALPVSSEFARLANSSIARDRLPFLVDDAHAGIAGLQSAVLSSPIALLEHRLALESQRAQQLANHAQTLENVLAEERKRAAEQTRCVPTEFCEAHPTGVFAHFRDVLSLFLSTDRELQNAHEGLARWRSTAEAAEKQFVSLKDLYHDERQANNRLSDVETECERLGFENMALQKVGIEWRLKYRPHAAGSR